MHRFINVKNVSLSRNYFQQFPEDVGQIKPKPQKPGRPKVNPVVPDILVSKKKLVPQKRAIAEPKKVPKKKKQKKQKKPLVKITSFFKKKTD